MFCLVAGAIELKVLALRKDKRSNSGTVQNSSVYGLLAKKGKRGHDMPTALKSLICPTKKPLYHAARPFQPTS